MTDDVTTHFHEAETPAMGVDRMPFWPVVAAGATGTSSLVQDGVSGTLIAPEGDVSPAYADAIARYIADPGLRAQHGAAGELRSREFSWDAINQAVADVYLRLVEAKPRA